MNGNRAVSYALFSVVVGVSNFDGYDYVALHSAVSRSVRKTLHAKICHLACNRYAASAHEFKRQRGICGIEVV